MMKLSVRVFHGKNFCSVPSKLEGLPRPLVSTNVWRCSRLSPNTWSSWVCAWANWFSPPCCSPASCCCSTASRCPDSWRWRWSSAANAATCAASASMAAAVGSQVWGGWAQDRSRYHDRNLYMKLLFSTSDGLRAAVAASSVLRVHTRIIY